MKNARGRVVSKKKSELSKGRRDSGVRRWSQAVKLAREKLGISGLVKVKKGQWGNGTEKTICQKAKSLMQTLV